MEDIENKSMQTHSEILCYLGLNTYLHSTYTGNLIWPIS